MKIRHIVSVLLAASLALLTACAPQTGGSAAASASQAEAAAQTASQTEGVSSGETSSAAASAKPLTDREGNEISVPDRLERIVSTAPSNTEVLLALGLGDKLVAVDKYSADVEGLPAGLPQLDFRNADAEAIVELQPDIIIASGHNKVGGENPFALLEEAGICVVFIPSSDSVQGIAEDILFLGQVTGAEETARTLALEVTGAVEEIRRIAAAIPEAEKKTVYFEIGPAPNLYSFGSGTFLNEFIEAVGAENIFGGETGWISPSAEAVIEKNPDIILTNVNYIEDPIGEICGREGWESISAVKDSAVYSIDTNASSRSSHNAVKALREIARAVYPGYYA